MEVEWREKEREERKGRGKKREVSGGVFLLPPSSTYPDDTIAQ